MSAESNTANRPGAIVTSEIRDGVMTIVTDSPPVNALSAQVRAGLLAALRDAEADPAVKGAVIACAGRTFFAGADITEFGRVMAEPTLPQLAGAIEACAKPVVAAIHGTALGGGLELALACHYRIAVPSARLGLPEVKLGLLPGAGGTQRLPRLTGMETALGMIAKGDPVEASEALHCGLVDRLAGEDGLIADAVGFTAEVAALRPLPRASERAVDCDPAVFAAFREANARRFRGFEAPNAIVDLLEASADRPFGEGIAMESRAFEALLAGTQSAAQRHLFFAERAAAKIRDVPPDMPQRTIARVGVIGAGTMGGGIAMAFLSAGFPVTLVDASEEALRKAAATIGGMVDASAAKGRMTGEQARAAMQRLMPTLDFASLADADLIVEAAYEDMTVKKEIFARLDRIARPGAILATNTSFLDIDIIAASISRPADVVGMHFFSPAHVMKLLEVVRGARTAKDVLATVMTLAKRIGKIAVVARVCHGFIGNRMLVPRQIHAEALLMDGATPSQIDAVHVAFGMPMGPFQMADLAGLDIGWHRDPNRIETLRDAFAAQGRWGQKTGAGFYDYDDKRRPHASPVAEALIARFRASSGHVERAISEEEIVVRTLYTMVDEAARILEEGIAQRAGDIDVVWTQGYGWPAYRGGPMFWADTIGLPTIVAGLEKYGLPVAPLLRETAARDGRFNR
ncbi:3-hydroxyacyl-CoA dehydrogenase [Novosphingobium sp. PC22D]|uniref:3-hydroxyacyl-CoA dehydrogenase NAD-binding domain-containing protein n=1 Tax=Novosphingobium sp. PC22D TaxID=1962403 RepID=UPI000BF13D69|nr:3-hydroxyacyl-CoA dehydrogenase NAD-binding domain-containing protein [Novosphingobium sp. PC22D]PEQ10587.1 3-hydroxyacyl-CoA dehydrogenase [Novosphingobium sp. PC22D]